MRFSSMPEVIPVTEVDASEEAPKTFFRSLLDRIALRLNQRPRKTLGFQTPAAILEAGVALTG